MPITVTSSKKLKDLKFLSQNIFVRFKHMKLIFTANQH